jgi:hypothetical protein
MNRFHAGLLLGLGACATLGGAPSGPSGATDVAVLAAVLDSVAAPRRPLLVLLDSTVTLCPDAPLLRDAASPELGVDSTTVASLRERSSMRRPVPPITATRRRRVEVIGRGELPLAGRRGQIEPPVGTAAMQEWMRAWAEWSQRHGGAVGFYRVSAVGYSRDGRAAVVYVVQTCGLRCGTTWLVSARRTGRTWRVSGIKVLTMI